MYRTGLILVFSLSSLGSFAQSKESFAWYDKLTYELYLNQNWDKLIEQGNKALNAGYDYFYLRMRIGIANYNKGYYRASIPHFSKALSYNNSDPLTLEYLFYAYRFSGRLIDANLLYQKYEDQLKARDVNKMSGFITGIYSEGGLKFISPKNENYGPLKYLHGGINQQFGGRLNLYQGYMRISQNNYDNSGAPTFGPSNNDQAISKYIQNDYYLKAVVPLAF